MCNFTPSEIRTRPEMSEQTINAIGEMVHAAVMHFDPDHTGPVEFTACRPHPWCGVEDDIDEPEEECELCGEWNRCTCYDDTDESDDHEIEEEFFYAQHSF